MEFPVLISTLASAQTLVAALFNERDRQKAAAIQVDLTDKLIQAQVQLSQVLAAVIEKDRAVQVLAERVRELEDRQLEKSRYQLAKASVVGDFFAYRLRPASELSERKDEPPHFLCQPCFDVGKKSVLQVGKHVAVCPLCNVKFLVAPMPERARSSVQSSSLRGRDW